MFDFTEDKKHAKSSWITKSTNSLADSSIKKPWGHEIAWGGFNGIHGKILFIRAGHSTSLKFHNLKSEVLFLRIGEATVTHGDERVFSDPLAHPFKIEKMEAGDTFLVQSGCPYKIRADSDCEIVEIGNYKTDKPVRIEDDYGRVGKL